MDIPHLEAVSPDCMQLLNEIEEIVRTVIENLANYKLLIKLLIMLLGH